MLGLKSPAYVVTSLAMLGLSLFGVTSARAQTPNVPVDKPVVEASTPVAESPAKVHATTIKTADATVTKIAEATAAKTEAAPATPQATPSPSPTPPPCPAGTRLV